MKKQLMKLPPPQGRLSVENLTVMLPNVEKPLLQGITFTVEPGEGIGVIGPTGAGKSTLAKLMARLYDPTEGAVTFAGTDLRKASLASLRDRIVVIPQEGFLFGGTILVEVTFALPGIGGLLAGSVTFKDIPVVQAITLITALVIVGVSILLTITPTVYVIASKI